ncbi:MAG TPA: methyltransferase domain-containing protein, partial [Gaiellaceae bacterium]|nr:methyltransferase domain-containing protein [Gaiellaceae bacterium]
HHGGISDAADFLPFVLRHLPAPPARVLEVGCGDEGGLVPELAARGYDVLGADPNAPVGERYVRAGLETLPVEPWDAVVAGRVLHHVEPLDGGVARLASFAPLILVDEFAPELIAGAAQAWYDERRVAAGDVRAPASIDEWRSHREHLHPSGSVLAALRRHYDERELAWVPYLHRWLRSAAIEAEERAAVAAGELPAIGWRWAGVRRA